MKLTLAEQRQFLAAFDSTDQSTATLVEYARFIRDAFFEVEALQENVTFFDRFLDQLEGYPAPKNHHLYAELFLRSQLASFDHYAELRRAEFARQVHLLLEKLGDPLAP